MNPRQMPALIGSLAATLALVGCGLLPRDVGQTVTDERTIEDVTAVSLATGGSLTITTGEEPSLTVTAGRNVIDLLTSSVHDGVLVLDEKRGIGRNLGRVAYDLVLPVVGEIRIDGSGDTDAELAPTEDLKLSISGSGDLTARGVAVDKLEVDVAGSGTVALTGSARRQKVRLEGSGDYAGADLDSEDAAISIAGSADADVQASRTLDAAIAGSGSVTYSGDAKVTSRVSGSGEVAPR